MAYKSLIDYYGGGMVKPSDGYQLGGLVAGARRQRDYSGELRGLQQLAEQSAKRKQKAQRKGGILKTALGIGGTLLGGPLGSAVGSALGQALGERSYKDTSFKGGKYAQDIRGQLGEQEKAYKGQGMARVGLAGLAGYGAGKAGGMFGKAASGIKGGIGQMKDIAGFLKEGGTMGDVLGGYAQKIGESGVFGDTGISRGLLGIGAKAGIAPTVTESMRRTMTDEGRKKAYEGAENLLTANTPQASAESYGPLAEGYAFPEGGNIGNVDSESYGPLAEGYAFPEGGNIGNVDYGGENFASTVPDSAMVNQYTQTAGGVPYGGGVGTGGGFMSGIFNMLSPSLSMPRVGPNYKGGGMVDYMMPQGYQGGGQVGYGTATDPLQALEQMGMGDVAKDPKLEDYIEDLPQFTMGYKQQLGDVMAGGRSGLMDISQQSRTQQAGTGFAGGGAGAVGQARARKELQRGVGTQRRGVVEGYQADLLSALADIESKGGFEFGAGGGELGTGLVDVGANYDPSATGPAGWPSKGAYDNWVQSGSDPNTAAQYGWQATEPGATPGYKT